MREGSLGYVRARPRAHRNQNDDSEAAHAQGANRERAGRSLGRELRRFNRRQRRLRDGRCNGTFRLRRGHGIGLQFRLDRSRRRHRGFKRSAPHSIEIVEILVTGRDEGMVVREDRLRDLIRPPVELLRIVRLVEDFADNAEIVQRVGEARIERAKFGLLEKDRAAQQLIGGGVVAGCSGFFRCFDD